MTFSDLTVVDYSSRSIAVQGNTRKYKEDLKKLGGTYNGRLKNGPGWVFPKSREDDVKSFIEGGKRLASSQEIKAGEERYSKRRPDYSEPSHTPINTTSPTLIEYGTLITLIKSMADKIDKMDKAVTILLNKEQRKQLEKMMLPPEKKVKKVVNEKKVEVSDNSDDSDDSNDSSSEDEELVQPLRRLMRG